MEQLPQLFMRHPDLSKLPPLTLSCGYYLHNFSENDKKSWEEIMEKAFDRFFSFEEHIRNWKGYKPENIMFLMKDGKNVASASGVEKEEFPNEGWLHMVGALPDETGKGAGKTVVLAALHALSASGFKTAVLSTDDERIPAIKLYYRLGFRPIYSHESHKERWEKILPLCK